jgi:hypothetical protein
VSLDLRMSDTANTSGQSSDAAAVSPEVQQAIEGAVSRLRAELEGAGDGKRQSRLLAEIAEIEEGGGDVAAAMNDYAAACEADPDAREAVEGLLRLALRTREKERLKTATDALVLSAGTAEERARAHLLHALFEEDVAGDLQSAKSALEDAASAGAPPAEAGPAWLSLEIVAAKLKDAETREEALGERVKLAGDELWGGLLAIDQARLAAEAGDVDRATELLDRLRTERGPAAYAAAVALERVAWAEPGLPGSDEARKRAMAYAGALESQAELIQEALDDAVTADDRGVPRWRRTLAHVVDAWLRAADARRALGDLAQAGSVLDRALQNVKEDGESRQLWTALVSSRVRIAELLGDTALAAQLAEKRLATNPEGGIAAALAMRVAEQAASEGDASRALDALLRATSSDPMCIPARALQLDILADAGDVGFAAQLEAVADHFTSDDAKGRAYLLSAWIWATRAGDAAAAKAALAQAGACGVAPAVLARFARSLASLSGDAAWYEDATRRLVATGPDEAELAMLHFELARSRFARGDAEGGHKALRELAALPKGTFLGRTLAAFLPSETGSAEGRRAAVEELAQVVHDGDVASSLAFIGALRAHAVGDKGTARDRLRKIVALDPSDLLAAIYLARLERADGAHEAAANALSACASEIEDKVLAAALQLEAACERWVAGDRAGAVAAFEACEAIAPAAGKTALAWASRGVDVDSPDGRRAAMARALEGGADARVVALERFGLEATTGDPEDATAALARLDKDDGSVFGMAAALARVAWVPGARDEEGTRAALDRIAATGEEGACFAAAERARIARETNGGGAEAAQAWFDAGGGLEAGIEWLAAAAAANDVQADVEARRALAEATEGETREALLASASMLEAVTRPNEIHPMLSGEGPSSRLVNLELAPPGCDPRRRHAALSGVGQLLGEEAWLDARALGAWSLLVSGRPEEALEAFRDVTFARPEDLHAWEGMRTAAEAVGNKESTAVAAEQLGARCADDARGAMFWEQAAALWVGLGNASRGEAALDASFERDPSRASAFDKLFRMVRERKDGDKLFRLIERRLEHTDDPPEIGKLFWEQARVLREKGDSDGALKALENVTMLEPDHVGALALTGEIFIRRGMYEEAAKNLSRLAKVEDAPPKNRVTAGVAAVDLYENKLNRHDLALEVLVALHRAKLSTLPVRERLARAAARTGAWREATGILEELMNERPEAEGRIEAARLAMAIHRDRLGSPAGAVRAVLKLLSESPGDGEALDMLLGIDADPQVKERMLRQGREVTLKMLQQTPVDLAAVRRVAHISRLLMDDAVQQAALSICLALNGPDGNTEQVLGQLLAKKPRFPQIALTEQVFRHVLAPGDEGPLAQLFAVLGPTLAEALGPSLTALGVTKKDRVDPRSGLAVRNEIAAWAGAFGIHEFDLYVGGKDPMAVQGVPGETPALVVGPQINAPLNPMTRARVARELLAIVRGTTVTRWRDDTTIAAIVVAACNLADVRVDSPPYAVLAEVEKLIGKAIARKTRKQLPEICRAIVASGTDARAWTHRALASHNRVAVIASGDVSVVLADLLGASPQIVDLARHDARAHELFRFVLSPAYFEIRRALGLEGTS